MPKILERFVNKLVAQGTPKAVAYAIATKQLQNSRKRPLRGRMTPRQNKFKRK